MLPDAGRTSGKIRELQLQSRHKAIEDGPVVKESQASILQLR